MQLVFGAEQALAGTKDDRVDHQEHLIDDTVRQEGPDQPTASIEARHGGRPSSRRYRAGWTRPIGRDFPRCQSAGSGVSSRPHLAPRIGLLPIGVGSSRTPKLGGPDELPEQLSPTEVSLGTKVVEPTNLLCREVDRDGLPRRHVVRTVH